MQLEMIFLCAIGLAWLADERDDARGLTITTCTSVNSFLRRNPIHRCVLGFVSLSLSFLQRINNSSSMNNRYQFVLLLLL
jgi:hypothetical protein